jgi:hypothetical protein
MPQNWCRVRVPSCRVTATYDQPTRIQNICYIMGTCGPNVMHCRCRPCIEPCDETSEIAGPILNAVQNSGSESAIDKGRLVHRTSISMWQCNWSYFRDLSVSLCYLWHILLYCFLLVARFIWWNSYRGLEEISVDIRHVSYAKEYEGLSKISRTGVAIYTAVVVERSTGKM